MNHLKRLFISPDCISLLTEVRQWLTFYHLATTHSVNFFCLETVALSRRAYLWNDTCLIRTYKIVNREALKV